MTEPVCLMVYGVPQPQGSKTPYVRGGRPILTDAGTKALRTTRDAWRQAVATAARDWQEAHHQAPFDCPVALEVRFSLPRPSSAPKKRRYPDRKPDADKLVRAVMDGLSKLVYTDDARVVEIRASKRYAVEEPPHAQVTICPVEDP